MTVTPDTAALCLNLLDQVTLQGSDPDLEAKVAAITKARAELKSVLVPPSEATA